MPQKSLLEQWAELFTGDANSKTMRHGKAWGGRVATDAPGTQSRTDVITPDTPDAKTHTGLGHPDQLGYHQHGTVAPPERRQIITRENKRYPNLAHHGRPAPEVPDYNVFYDHWGTREAWDKIILSTAHGSWVFGTTTTQAVTLDTLPNLKLSQFPGALMAFPVLISWSYALSAAGTSGEFSASFVPQGGDFSFPLSEGNITVLQYTQDTRWIVPAPVVDRNPTQLGNLIITSNSIVGTPTLFWRMGFGWAYLLQAPAFKGYIPLHAGQAYHEEED